jgi:hypothetical protein
MLQCVVRKAADFINGDFRNRAEPVVTGPAQAAAAAAAPPGNAAPSGFGRFYVIGTASTAHRAGWAHSKKMSVTDK